MLYHVLRPFPVTTFRKPRNPPRAEGRSPVFGGGLSIAPGAAVPAHLPTHPQVACVDTYGYALRVRRAVPVAANGMLGVTA